MRSPKASTALMVRLVKGAYWDTEVKRAQERGPADYPVFTRKAMTDLNYIACAAQLLACARLFPQFATHNALTVATIARAAGDAERASSSSACTAWARRSTTALGRGGRHRLPHLCAGRRPPDLLAYLVRRLLENGANSSFVCGGRRSDVPVDKLLAPPATSSARRPPPRRIPLPADLYRAAAAQFRRRRVRRCRERAACSPRSRRARKSPPRGGRRRPIVDGKPAGPRATS
jgi:RHH-type proline utilization regulon transcriptional repressor/proline dehydrogenase/delta 1-pyrroline-5-carboxylate dehydrogenase